jgi:hypothetical protein
MIQKSFYEELEEAVDHIPKYRVKILLGDLNVKFGREDFLNQQLGMRVYIRMVMKMM